MQIVTELSALASMALTVFKLFQAVKSYREGVEEKRLQGTQQRADFFLKKQHELLSNPSFTKIRSLLETDDMALRSLDFEEKRAFLTFFEEIALSLNSGLIREDVAYYMFGYYAIKCDNSKNFWKGEDGVKGVNKVDIFWGVFLAFAKKMQIRMEQNREIVVPDLRF